MISIEITLILFTEVIVCRNIRILCFLFDNILDITIPHTVYFVFLFEKETTTEDNKERCNNIGPFTHISYKTTFPKRCVILVNTLLIIKAIKLPFIF